MILVDVHAHMDFPEFAADLPEVIERAKNSGVTAIISHGVHDASNRTTLALAKKYPLIRPALGLYPLNAPNVNVLSEDKDFDRTHARSVDDTLRFIREHAKELIAIGEVGIDLHFSEDEQHQVENFTRILQLAHTIKKPVVIHSRKAEKLVLDILEDAKFERAVLHCFSGGQKLITRAADLGYSLTVTSNANRSQHFQLMARIVPLGQLLTETDAPLLGPVVGARNEPQNVRVAIATIAKQKGLNADEAARVVYMNYQTLFL